MSTSDENLKLVINNSPTNSINEVVSVPKEPRNYYFEPPETLYEELDALMNLYPSLSKVMFIDEEGYTGIGYISDATFADMALCSKYQEQKKDRFTLSDFLGVLKTYEIEPPKILNEIGVYSFEEGVKKIPRFSPVEISTWDNEHYIGFFNVKRNGEIFLKHGKNGTHFDDFSYVSKRFNNVGSQMTYPPKEMINKITLLSL